MKTNHSRGFRAEKDSNHHQRFAKGIKPATSGARRVAERNALREVLQTWDPTVVFSDAWCDSVGDPLGLAHEDLVLPEKNYHAVDPWSWD